MVMPVWVARVRASWLRLPMADGLLWTDPRAARAEKGLYNEKSVLFVGSVIIVMVVVVMTSNMRNVAKKDEPNRYINNGNGTITDTKTGLMWASKDNGSKINWLDARSYCQNFKGGGYTDWRMPTLKELSRLYDENRPRYHRTTPMITLSNQYIWAGKTKAQQPHRSLSFTVAGDSLIRIFPMVAGLYRCATQRNCGSDQAKATS